MNASLASTASCHSMRPIARKVLGAFTAFAGAQHVLGQSCQTTTVNNTVPSDNRGVQLMSYSYCSGTLNVTCYIQNVDYDKLVNVYYTNADNQATPLTVLGLNYVSSVANNYEIWFANNPNAYLDGVSQLLNVTYQATDVGQTYSQQLNIHVTPSGPPPSTSTVPAPYASPTGFAGDITQWLAAKSGSEAAIAKAGLFANIDVGNAANGTVAAATSCENPDYCYNWVRDASLTYDVVQKLYAAAPNGNRGSAYANYMFAYAGARATEQNDPNLQTGLGEPKFNLDNSVYTGPWGRPQNDGPATAANALMDFATAYMAAGGSINTVQSMIYDSDSNPSQAPVKKDLLFVAENWSSPTFDIWEEEQGDQFYDRLVHYRAMVQGADFATKLGDSDAATTLSSAAGDIRATLGQYWDPVRGIILYEYGPVLHNKYTYKDTAAILGVIHSVYLSSSDTSSYGPTSDQVLSTALQVSTTFLPLYPIAFTTTDSSGQPLGIPIGRYPEDTYNGVSTSAQGNPWNLCTAAFAELFYRAATDFGAAESVTVSNTSLPFWQYFAPAVAGDLSAGQTYDASTRQYSGMIAALQGWGDAFIRTIKHYAPESGTLTEEIDRSSGAPTGAENLTWSYGSLLTAALARAVANGDMSYAAELAGLAQ